MPVSVLDPLGVVGVGNGTDSTENTKRRGRLPGIYIHRIARYNDTLYAVITIQHKKKDIQFIIDNCNLNIILSKPWHLSSGKYIATHYTLPNGKIKEIYLHNFIKDNFINDSQDKIVIHINNNMLDNRLENLRTIESTAYFPLRNNHKRRITLPPHSGFTADDIPKYISFMKASGDHSDRFSIEIPQLNIFLKLSSSKKLTLKEKFEEAKKKLNEIYITYPIIDPTIDDMLKMDLNTSLAYILKNSIESSNENSEEPKAS